MLRCRMIPFDQCFPDKTIQHYLNGPIPIELSHLLELGSETYGSASIGIHRAAPECLRPVRTVFVRRKQSRPVTTHDTQLREARWSARETLWFNLSVGRAEQAFSDQGRQQRAPSASCIIVRPLPGVARVNKGQKCAEQLFAGLAGRSGHTPNVDCRSSQARGGPYDWRTFVN